MDEIDISNDFDRIFNEGGDLPLRFPDLRSEPAENVKKRAAGKRRPAGDARPTVTVREDEEQQYTASRQEDAPENDKAATLRISDLTEEEKPREKALKQGIDSLTDVELLAILLGSGIPGKSVLDLSREILKDNDGRIGYLSKRSIPELVRKYKGMGVAKATLLCAAMTFGARAQSDLQIKNPQITTSESVYSYMRPRLERLNNEEFWVLHLSRSNRVQSLEQISKGGLHQTSVDVKLIAKSVIDRLSSAVILCHNHPSGNMMPSGADDSLTHRIVEICKLVDVTVLDHVIVGPTGFYSYRDNGRL